MSMRFFVDTRSQPAWLVLPVSAAPTSLLQSLWRLFIDSRPYVDHKHAGLAEEMDVHLSDIKRDPCPDRILSEIMPLAWRLRLRCQAARRRSG
jgi:hypothetical protein